MCPLCHRFFLSVLWVCVYGCMRALKNHPPAFKPTPSPMHASSSLYASRVFSVINDLHEVCHTHTHVPPSSTCAIASQVFCAIFVRGHRETRRRYGDRLGRRGGWANGGSAQECVFFLRNAKKKEVWKRSVVDQMSSAGGV